MFLVSVKYLSNTVYVGGLDYFFWAHISCLKEWHKKERRTDSSDGEHERDQFRRVLERGRCSRCP